ncbi:FAD-dependent oxidoreductase [bacterium]|nr:FAD-dependent oxidoreductase [bacterium]
MYDLIIIGAGIAGCTAAVYASRDRLNFLMVSKEFGGQFLESGQIFNYPGFVEISGYEFHASMRKQLEANDVKLNLEEDVKGIERINGGFKVLTDKNKYETKTIIIATGSGHRTLNVPGEKEFKNKGVTYCAICDGPLFKGKDIAIVGGGNSALEGVEITRNFVNKVYLINIGKDFTGYKYLIEKLEKASNVEIINEAKTKEIVGDNKVTGLKYEKNGQEKTIKVDGVIVEIGRNPNTGFAEGVIELDEHRHVKIDCECRTSVPGIFSAGDCASGHEYQYVIAAGQGCTAFLKVMRYLADN